VISQAHRPLPDNTEQSKDTGIHETGEFKSAITKNSNTKPTPYTALPLVSTA
jgi:hypothetical protein